jgi:hypothetical protein
VGEGEIRAHVTFEPDRGPAKIELRLPHPDGLKARAVRGGVYDAGTETVTVTIEPLAGQAEVSLKF